ncbi:alpha/beta fold hydrolase [Escherichia albertii]|uniref:alpha/beta fold hydrolase n=1 Tax=Escherichia albertii TaxID=208962 RepID=UPI002360CEDF|nr:alpha/beta fold hydrolase [Escherichia albertii]WDB80087.1 alpha/beta fold hydrolase [Escherichia albertii]
MSNATLHIRNLGSFFVGGQEYEISSQPTFETTIAKGCTPSRLDPNGQFEAGQMYVQFIELEQPQARWPLVFVHGGGMTGACWETTPDGRPGMHHYFLRHGHNTYVCDGVERGRASWAQYPHIYAGQPQFRTKQQAWESFRFGPNYPTREVWPGQQFPVEAFDIFMKQAVPRWTCNDALAEAAYAALLAKLGKSVILAHSQGCGQILNVVQQHPERVAAVILLEPSGAPDTAGVDLTQLRDIPFLVIWGDNLDAGETWWPEFYRNVTAWAGKLSQANVPVTWLELPKLGIHGNSHILIMDRNADDIAALIQNWMSQQGLLHFTA